MADPITLSIAVGVAGNLATNVVQALGEKIEDTRVGKSLIRAGVLKPGFQARLRDTLESATREFLENNSAYGLPEIHRFLESKSFARDLRDMLLEQRGLDVSRALLRLESYVGIPISEAPDSWPNNIVPETLINDLFSTIVRSLGAQSDPGILWLSTFLANQQLTLSSISSKIDIISDSLNSSDDQSEFYTSYIDHLISRAQRVSTPGARELRGINQSLSVAYISLNLKAATGSEGIRAESFLSDHPHVAIRGPAGSGKTTLLNWLITKCDPAQNSPSDKWSGYVPFLIPLRKVARLHPGPPSVDRFVEYSVDNKLWSRPTPPGWIDKIIGQRKKAILMIDGVDELPPSRRVEFWDWLGDFVDQYPATRIIVTSRALPGASVEGVANEQWSIPRGFTEAQLQDMSDADVTSFIHHWHDAIDHTKLDEQELASLAEARATLPIKLEDSANRRIRELCNTPLLCAMVCVLHWREEGYLPRHRVEVYERCCDMLIEARDHKRGVHPPPGPISFISKSEKEMVLQQLAIQMMHNRDDSDSAVDDEYRIEISKGKAIAWIAPLLSRFQNAEAREATPDQVLDYLVERTGLLREPAVDLIDFPHRTFQEYLAACAAGADSQESMLARQADDDQWHETIMLAAGTNTGGVGFGKKLIETLIQRGERHKGNRERSLRIRKTCFALALGCLENLRQQEESLRERVLSNLAELVPPRSDADARILSVAGDAAVSYLAFVDWKDENTATVAACAQALRLIGTTEAHKALARGYTSDTRQPVVAEVCRTGAFAYSEIPLVVSAVGKDGRLPGFAATNDLSLVSGLSGLRELELDVLEIKHIERISELSDLASLSLEHVSEKSDFLHDLPNSVSGLSVSGKALPLGDWGARLHMLERCSLIGVNAVDIVRLIDSVSGLKSLSVVASDFTEVDALHRLKELTGLYLAGLSRLDNLGSLGSHASLTSLRVEECLSLEHLDLDKGFEHLEQLSVEQRPSSFAFRGRLSPTARLKKLEISDLRGIGDLEAFRNLPSLESLEIFRCPELTDLSAIEDMTGLRELNLSNLSPQKELRICSPELERIRLSGISLVKNSSFGPGLQAATSVSVERCVQLDTLDIFGTNQGVREATLSMMPRISDLDPLSSMKSLTSLNLYECDGVQWLAPIAGLPIEELSLFSMNNLSDVEVISQMQTLRTLSIGACSGLTDLNFAVDLPQLERIWLLDHGDDIHVPESLRPKISRSHSGRNYYMRQRKPWWPESVWMMHEYEYPVRYWRHRRLPMPKFQLASM